MNPYLRIGQPERPSAYYFAKQKLQAPWAETEPFSSTIPDISARLQQEWSIGTQLDAPIAWAPWEAAIGAFGIYFGPEYVGTAWGMKFLVIIDGEFTYGGLTTHNGKPLSGDPLTLSPFSKTFNEHINDPDLGAAVAFKAAISKAYYQWKPAPPDSLKVGMVREALIGILKAAEPGAIPEGITYHGQHGSQQIRFVLWKYGGFLPQGTFPIFFITGKQHSYLPTSAAQIQILVSTNAKQAAEFAVRTAQGPDARAEVESLTSDLELAVKHFLATKRRRELNDNLVRRYKPELFEDEE